MEGLDSKDKKILDALRENARLSAQEVSKKCLIPVTTAYNRMKRLEQQGVIKGYTTVVDPKKLGLEVSAHILATVDYTELKKGNLNQTTLASRIKRFPEVESVSIIAGEKDLVIKVWVENVEALNSFVVDKLRNLPGIEKTDTLVVLKQV